MTDTENRNEGSGERKAHEPGSIIDATARRRPIVHGNQGVDQEETAGLGFLRDVPLRLDIILGETEMSLGEVIALETDSIVELDKLSGDPIDIYVEDQKLGRGEVVVLHEKIRIRLLEITPSSRSWRELKDQKEEEE